ncbi:hypothetical protein K8S19_01180 [bacterium]|nr:hypothetical protein [bacterium]
MLKKCLLSGLTVILWSGIVFAQPEKGEDYHRYAARVNLKTEQILLMQIAHFTNIEVMLDKAGLDAGMNPDVLRKFARSAFLKHFEPEQFGPVDYKTQVSQAPLAYGFITFHIRIINQPEFTAWICRMRLNNFRDFPWQYSMIVFEAEATGQSARSQLGPDIAATFDTLLSRAALRYYKARNSRKREKER